MVRVIGQIPVTRIAECDFCGAVISYEPKDVCKVTLMEHIIGSLSLIAYCIDCPKCNKEVRVQKPVHEEVL